VVRERKGGRRQAPSPPAADEVADGSGWDVSGVSADEIATVRRFLERRHTLDPGPRSRLARDLAGRLRARVAGAPEGLESEAFLESLAEAKAARG